MDDVARTLLDRVRGLLKARPDLETAQFFRAIGRPTPSWASEFLNGKRTTNDLRLVVKMAKVFGVPVAYLLGQGNDRDLDPGAATLLSTWETLDADDRTLLLNVAASFRRRAIGTGGESPEGGGPGTGPRKRSRGDEPPRPKR